MLQLSLGFDVECFVLIIFVLCRVGCVLLYFCELDGLNTNGYVALLKFL